MRRRAGWLAPVLAGMLVLSGCAQSDVALSAESAGRLQAGVVSVAQMAATGDYAAAAAELDALQVELDTARGQGDVTDERAASIQAAIDVVRADLSQSIESETPSAPVEDGTDVPVSDAPAPQPEPEPEKSKPGRDEDGPGRGNGNGGKGGGPGR